MSDHTPTIWPFSVLELSIDVDHLRTVIEYALSHRKDAAREATRDLDRIIRKKLKVDGYRDGSKAPVRLLMKEINTFPRLPSELLGLAFRVWATAQSNFQESSRAFLEGRGIPVVTESERRLGFPGRWTIDEMEEQVGIFLETHPDHARDDVSLMLCYLSGRISLPEDFLQDEGDGLTVEDREVWEGDEDVNWSRWLEALRALPADAPDWEGVGAFVEEVQRLASAKWAEKEGRDELRQALLDLIEECAEDLKYFRMVEVAGWRADRCPLADARLLVTQVREFHARLAEYRVLRQQKGDSIQEDRQLRENRAALDEQIFTVYRAIGVALRDPTSDSPGPEPLPSEREEEVSGDPEPQPPLELPLDPTDSAGSDRLPGKLGEEGKTPAVAPVEPESSGAPGIPESPPEPQGIEDPQETYEAPSEGSGPVTPLDVDTSPPEPISEEQPIASQPLSGTTLSTPTSVKEAAALLHGDDREDLWQGFFYALVRENDLAGAYWLARSAESLGQTPGIPSWLLKAVQGARWVKSNTDPVVTDLLDIVRANQPDDSEEQRLFGLAAALHATLIAPGTGLIDWMSEPMGYSALHKLVEAVREFVGRGRVLYPEDTHGIAGATQYEGELSAIAREAKQWLSSARDRSTRMPRATRVWQNHLVSPTGEVFELLSPVGADARHEVVRVRELLQRCQDRPYIVDRVHEIDGRRIKIRSKEITGDPLEQIFRWVTEACELASRWCKWVEREHEHAQNGDWWYRQVNELRTEIQGILGEVHREIEIRRSQAESGPVGVAIDCLSSTIGQVCHTLSVPHEDSQYWAVAVDRWRHLLEQKAYLSDALNQRLLLLPSVDLDDTGTPTEEVLPRIRDAIRDNSSEDRTIEAATTTWIGQQDYRFTDQLMALIETEEIALELARRCQEALDGSRLALREEKDRTRAVVEQAVVDGIIGEERPEFTGKIDAIDPEKTRRFSPKFRMLQEIRNDLGEARKQRLRELENNWEALQIQMRSSVKPAKWDEAQEFIKEALAIGDTRVVDECLAQLRRAVDEGRDLSENLFSYSGSRDVLSEFVDRAEKISEWIADERGLQQVAKSIIGGSTHADIAFGKVPKPRRDEAVEAIEAWRRLKQGGAKSRDNPRHIQTLLEYLGFLFSTANDLPIRTREDNNDWLYVHALMTAGDLAKPIPQFGSLVEGRYNVVCLWERPGVDTMSAWLRQMRLDAHSVIVFYLGRLTTRQRHELAARARDREFTVALLDESLLIFLAGEHDVRLPAFLRCALPAASVNPYTPYRAGDVPPEMFYGRDEMVRELLRPSGSCLVYGGRQLGKSALLRHVQREFHHPDRGQYAWVEDIKMFGENPTADAVWGKLREGFKAMGLLPAQVSTEKPESIARHIEKVILEKQCRVTILFDESDRFLNADAANNFRVVEGLRTLMVNTERRIKVIFAGLHSVQRFQGIPNQPLAHFGMPLCVGPLDPPAAQQLVREPIEVLGFRFRENATVLRVLSYTNYHPGLIQLFCHELLKRLYARTKGRLAPYDATSEDVEAVYLAPEVQKRIRELLEFTIALDSRYQAIVWATICDQISLHDSYAQAYPPANILELVRGWWPRGFRDVGSEQIRGLLDEMCGLGVMVRNRDGYYRLRSPNLVRLLGTDEDIESKLLELAGKEPEKGFDADSFHAPLDDAGRRYSPLTYSQERMLSRRASGVGLVFASEALEGDQIAESFKYFVPGDLQEDAKADCTEIPGEVQNRAQFQTWVERYLKANSKHEQLVVYKKAWKGRGQLAEQVESAIEVCRRREKTQRQWMRLLFILDPEETWEWLALPEDRREEMENQVDSLVFAGQWNHAGIRQRLEQRNMMSTDEVCREVAVATGGWPLLLEELFDRCGSQVDPRSCAGEIAKELSDPASRLTLAFRAALGIDVVPAGHHLVKFLQEEPRVPLGMIFPKVDPIVVEMVGGEPTLSPEDCGSILEFLRRIGCVKTDAESIFLEDTFRKVF